MCAYYCNNCGEENKFYATQDYSEHGTEMVYLDRDGETIDYGDRDEDDFDHGDMEDFRCLICDKEVNDYTEAEIDRMKKARTNNQPVNSWRQRIQNEKI